MVAEMGLFSDELLRLLLYCVPLWDNMKPNSPMNRNYFKEEPGFESKKRSVSLQKCHIWHD